MVRKLALLQLCPGGDKNRMSRGRSHPAILGQVLPQKKEAFCDAINLSLEVRLPLTVRWKVVKGLKQGSEVQEWCGNGNSRKHM